MILSNPLAFSLHINIFIESPILIDDKNLKKDYN